MRAQLAVPLGAVFLLTLSHGVGFLRGPELKTLDVDYHVRARLHPPGPPDERLVVVGLDERTNEWMRERGIRARWDVWAGIVGTIAEAGPRAIFFDVLMTQEDLDGELATLAAEVKRAEAALTPESAKKLDQLVADLGSGQRLLAAMRKAPVVLPVSCPENDRPREVKEDELHAVSLLTPISGTSPSGVRRVLQLGFPAPDFAGVAVELAPTCEWNDADNILRRDPSLLVAGIRGQDRIVPSISVALARRALDLPPDALTMSPTSLQVGPHSLVVDEAGASLLAWSGPGRSFMTRARQGKPSTYSAVAILEKEVDPKKLAGKIVLVGATVSRGTDSKAQPFGYATGSRTPGVEKIAMQTDAILRGETVPYRPWWSDRLGFLLTAITGVAGVAAGIRLRPLVATAAIITGILAILALGGLAFTWGPWIDTAHPVLAFAAGGLLAGSFRYAEQEQRQRFLREAFAKYLDPAMVEKLMAERDRLRLFGEDKELTILFADVRGFTSRSEKSSPAEIVAVLNSHLTAMAKVIHAHNGTLDKFVGDCVMAFWGAPIEDADHARHAVEASLAMLAKLDEQNAERAARGEPAVEMGIGLNTGRVIVGNMGSETRFDYTVIGDAVNTASRLESLTKEAKCRVLLGERTAELVRGTPLDPVEWGRWEVKGKTGKLPVFTPRSIAEKEKAPPATTPAAAAPRTTPASPS